MNELLVQVLASESEKHIWRNDYSSLNWKNASRLNVILFNLPLNKSIGCNCIEDLFFMLEQPNINQKIKTIMAKKFKVKPGKLIQTFGCDHVSEHSSDELCILLLKKYPQHIKNFESYPSNWEEIVENYEPRKAGEAINETPPPPVPEGEGLNSNPETNDLRSELMELTKSDLKDELMKAIEAGAEIEIPKNANKTTLVELVIALRNDV